MKYLLLLLLFLTSFAQAADPKVKITAPVQTLAIGQSTTVTFVWSEAVTGFTSGDIIVKGDATISGFTGSGTTYTVSVQKLLDRNAISLNIDNNATTPAGFGGTIGFNVAPRVYIKESNAFLGKLVEANPQPRCPLPGEYLADSGGNPTTRIDENYYIYVPAGNTRALSLQQLRFDCLARLTGGLQFLKKVAPKNFELANVHGAHNHSKLMPAITTQQIAPLVGTTKTRVRPANVSDCPLNAGKYLCNGSGDFRAGNVASKFDADDPIVYPGQKGAAHFHIFYGNNSVNYQTNTASLIKNCVSLFAGGCANATGYWAPPMVDTATNTALYPSGGILLYYKAESANVVPYIETLPQGLKIIAGNPAATTAAEQTDPVEYQCFGRSGTSDTAKFATIPSCSGNNYTFLRMTVIFPRCVADNGSGGMQLDSTDHRSHLIPSNFSGPRNANQCPNTFPHLIPGITQIIDYNLKKGETTATWRLSSDNYSASLPGGASGHADWWGGWKNYWAERMNIQCNRNLVNCGVNYIGLNDGVGINNITTVGNIATVTTATPHQLKTSNPDGTYPDTVATNSGANILRGRLTGVTGASASTYNFDPVVVTNNNAAYPLNGGNTVNPVGSQNFKIINANTIEITLPSTPTTLINGAVDPSLVKIYWGESLCEIQESCSQIYSDYYYGTKQ